ncbi:MAG TPA: hypothetical protein VI217_04855 [Mycobacterium sp.]
MGSTVSPEAAGSLGFGWVSTPLVDVGAVDVADSVVLVCAPPLLLMVTPDPTSVDEDVVLLVEVDPPLVDVDSPPVVAVDVVPVVDVAAGPVADSPDDVVPDAELVEDDSEDVPVVSAAANP